MVVALRPAHQHGGNVSAMTTKPQFPAEVNTSTDCAQAIHNLRTEEWLLDQTYFPLQPGAWGHFQAALDNPAPASPALVELLNQRPPWEKPDISSNPQMTDLSAGRGVAIFGQEIVKNPCRSKKNTPGVKPQNSSTHEVR